MADMPRLDKSGIASGEAVKAMQDAVARGLTLAALPDEETLRRRLATFMGDYGAWSPNSRAVRNIVAFLREWFYEGGEPEEEEGAEVDLSEVTTGDLMNELLERLPEHDSHLSHVRDQLGQDEWEGTGES